MDRYNHDLAGEDTDDTDDTPVIGSFSSYTPQYRKQHYSWSRASSTTSVSSSTTNTTTTATTSNSSTKGVNPSTAITLIDGKIQMVESTSPIKKLLIGNKDRKTAAPLSFPTPHSIATEALINSVLNTPQLRKIEVNRVSMNFS